MKRTLTALVILIALFIAAELVQTESDGAPLPPITTPETPDPRPPVRRARPHAFGRRISQTPAPAPEPIASSPPVESAPAEPHAAAVEPSDEPRCFGEAALTCNEGDVWWLDTCGALQKRLRRCGSGCADGECLRDPDAECDDTLALGQCDGGRVVSCHGGRVIKVDCAGHGLTCTMTNEEGAVCRKPPTSPCAPIKPQCVDGGLSVCIDGGTRIIDCDAAGATCDATSDGRARCVFERRREAEPDDDTCLCPPCERDEDLPASLVPVVAFVIADETSGAAWTEEDVKAEIDAMNALFGPIGGPTGLRFTLKATRTIQRPQWVDPGSRAINQMAKAPRIHPPLPYFYVPIVFVRTVSSGMVPKYGTATLPSPGFLDSGVVVLSRERHWTTGAHEVGHFLGLKHTHSTSDHFATRVQWPGGQADCTGCQTDGDAICDTPPDPGRSGCSYVVPSCEALCDGGGAPDVTNLMSYYHDCRRRFSPDQIVRMRAMLGIRKAARQRP